MDERTLLLVGFAQEVRDPLAALTGHLQVAQRCLARVQRIVDDITVGAAVAGKNLLLKPEPVHLAALLDEMHPLWFALPRDLIIHADLAPDLPPLLADEERLAQVLTNLLANVRKFCLRHEATICAKRDVDERLVHITVADKGPGIPRADRRLVFEPFYRIPRDRRRPGLGLGLYLVRSLVEAHGGKVRIGAGPGCVVHIRWPIAPDATPAAHGPSFGSPIARRR